MMKYLFGPVPSRRYGRSLGVDLAVPKTCTLSCRFCQLGPTPHTTVTRTAIPDIDAVWAELREWLAQGNTADYITASGSGEPTLHLHFGDLLRRVRDETDCRSLLLSNGSLFFLPEVRRDACVADVVKVSLHAWDQASFETVNRPHPSLRFQAILDGYRAFRETFTGRLDVEVFLIPGVNDRDDQAGKIAALTASFAPDSVTLNTAVRPPADSSITPCSQERLEALLPLFGPHAHIGGKEPQNVTMKFSQEALVGLVERHPVSLSSLAATFEKTEDELRALLQPLLERGDIRLFPAVGRLFVGGGERRQE